MYRSLRTALTNIFTQQIAVDVFEGKSLDSYVRNRVIKRQRHTMEEQLKVSDRKNREALRKRNARRNHLKELQSNALTASIYTQHLLTENGETAVDLAEPEDDVAAAGVQTGTIEEPLPLVEPVTVHRRINCYICKKDFFELHHFYEYLCPSCRY